MLEHDCMQTGGDGTTRNARNKTPVRVLHLSGRCEPLPETHKSHFRHVVKEFVTALGDRFTYSIKSNGEVLFGFLWGLPIPLFSIGLHLYVTSQPLSAGAAVQLIAQYPFHFIFVVHPFVFAVVFGAFGTMRARRDLTIARAMEKERENSERLAQSNERLRELDRMKDEFLANVTHELKSPLVTAIGYTDRILNGNIGSLNDRQRHGLEVGYRNLSRLRGLIDEILDFARMESGKAAMKIVTFDLRTTITGIFESVDIKAKDKNILLEHDLPPGPISLNADPGKIHQALLNLMDNSVKFSGLGTAVCLTVRAENASWHITVRDQGLGIQPAILSTLFERFRQADGSRAREHEGVGLGLVITRKIVELHNGRIWLESEPGRGTTAHVILPRVAVTAVPHA
jgi:signal transduction histidine kinase